MGGYTLMAARVLGALRAPHQVRWVQRLFGSLLIGMAALLATFRRSV
jgi:homoserine/homoserine lactone efflux protein